MKTLWHFAFFIILTSVKIKAQKIASEHIKGKLKLNQTYFVYPQNFFKQI